MCQRRSAQPFEVLLDNLVVSPRPRRPSGPGITHMSEFRNDKIRLKEKQPKRPLKKRLKPLEKGPITPHQDR